MKKFSPMLLLTINNSIGNKDNHFTVKQLVELFDKKQKDFTNRDKYAIDIIQTEANDSEINDFIEEHKILKEKVHYILSCKPYN